MMAADPNAEASVRRGVTVPLAPDRAFELFTARMTAFWPSDHHIGAVELAEVVIEGWPGGRWYERGVDGSECPWGHVAVWQPPDRLVLAWQINADWQFDPAFATEVEVTFTEHSPGHTRVELEHRHLDRYGEHAARMRETFDSPNGWTGILSCYVVAASGPSQDTTLHRYTRSLDQLARVLDRMPTTSWDSWSPCTEWTPRDIVGHTIWGQQLFYALATGTEPPSYRYVPGSERPGPLAGDDPVTAWHTTRAACAPLLDQHILAKVVQTRALGATTIGGFLDNLLTVDNTAHAWDLATTAGQDVQLDADLVAHATRWARHNETFMRESHQFGEPLTPPQPADAQTTLLAILGRRAW